jgi:hypothetical protein
MKHGLLVSIALACLFGLYCPIPVQANDCPPGLKVEWVESTRIVRVLVRH